MINKFWKVQASGNDFIVVSKNEFQRPEEFVSFIKKVCKRKTGIGADGFIILDKQSDSLLSWEFYNSDASSAEMCGNAARAICKLFVEKLGGAKKSTLLTLGGEVSLEYISKDELKVKMPKKDYISQSGEGHIWNTGVPHFVFQKDFSDLEATKTFAKNNRFPEVLDEKGANVSFWFEAKAGILATSFERGVEDFTLACGTGACACALDVLRSKNRETGSVHLSLPGGEVLIEVQKEAVFLIGEAEIIYNGKWSK
jgi:diaminopimelate epimerase